MCFKQNILVLDHTLQEAEVFKVLMLGTFCFYKYKFNSLFTDKFVTFSADTRANQNNSVITQLFSNSDTETLHADSELIYLYFIPTLYLVYKQSEATSAYLHVFYKLGKTGILEYFLIRHYNLFV